MELPQEVLDAKANASKLASQAGVLGAGGVGIEDRLRKAATEAYNSNQDIVGPLDTATKDYVGAPQVAREKYQDVFNPFSREKLVGQYVGNQALPMLSLSNILGQRMGGIGDIIQGGVNAYGATSTNATNEAQLARQNYQDLFNEYVTGEELRLKEQDSASGNPNFLDQLGLEIVIGPDGQPQLRVKGSGATPDGDPGYGAEPKPTTNPGMSSAISPGGQWMWEWSPNNPNPEWIPIID